MNLQAVNDARIQIPFHETRIITIENHVENTFRYYAIEAKVPIHICISDWKAKEHTVEFN